MFEELASQIDRSASTQRKLSPLSASQLPACESKEAVNRLAADLVPAAGFAAPATMKPACGQSLNESLALAKACRDENECEHLYDQTMVIARRAYLQELSNSKMPLSLKQRYAELKMIDMTVAVFKENPRCRRAIVSRLVDNLALGPGHFSVHRAKQAIKKVAQSQGLSSLLGQLETGETTDQVQAARLLGWLKSRDSLAGLKSARARNDGVVAQTISSVIAQHFKEMF